MKDMIKINHDVYVRHNMDPTGNSGLEELLAIFLLFYSAVWL